MSKNTPEVQETFYHKLGIPLLGLKAAVSAIEANRDTGNAVCLVGESGIGKTHITHQVAAARKPRKPFTWHGKEWVDSVPVVPFYLAHFQPEDLAVPYPSRAKQNEMLTRARQLQDLVTFAQAQGKNELAAQLTAEAVGLMEQVANMDARTKKNGTMEFLINKELFDLPPECILFFDEWNRADKGVAKSFFTLVEDGEVHGVNVITEGVQIVAAMNPSDGSYSINEAEKDPAFRRRLAFIAVTVNVGTWLNYARNRFHALVVDYVQDNNLALYDTKLRLAGKIFPCPAAWEKVSKLLQSAERNHIPFDDNGVRACIAGHIGETVGTQFSAYLQDKSIVIPAAEVLEKYRDNSEVRRRVRKLVTDARSDVLGELCGNVATLLMATLPPVEKIAAKLALFLGDLPSDTAIAFIVAKLGSASEGVAESSQYLTDLSVAMTPYPAYKGLIGGIQDALRKGRQETGESDPINPT